jgi:hypothetical protein
MSKTEAISTCDDQKPLPDAQTRAAMLATGMERGMEASYVRLEGMI